MCLCACVPLFMHICDVDHEMCHLHGFPRIPFVGTLLSCAHHIIRLWAYRCLLPVVSIAGNSHRIPFLTTIMKQRKAPHSQKTTATKTMWLDCKKFDSQIEPVWKMSRNQQQRQQQQRQKKETTKKKSPRNGERSRGSEKVNGTKGAKREKFLLLKTKLSIRLNESKTISIAFSFDFILGPCFFSFCSSIGIVLLLHFAPMPLLPFHRRVPLPPRNGEKQAE